MSPWVTRDGYKRVRLYSDSLKKQVNATIHLLVAMQFMNFGKYTKNNNGLQINHIDGNKLNNHVSNLELVTGIENVNHTHNMGLYTYDLRILCLDTWFNKKYYYRSLRDMSRDLNVSLNYIKPRLHISHKYPLNDRYKCYINRRHYIRHISKLNTGRVYYVYDYVRSKLHKLNSWSQLSILFGISYINVSRKMKENVIPYYIAGYSICLDKNDINKDYYTKSVAKIERDNYYRTLLNKRV